MKSFAVVALVLVSVLSGWGEEKKSLVFLQQAEPPRLTGNLSVDLLTPLDALQAGSSLKQQGNTVTISKKSPLLAAGMSVVLPGAGEFYAESYWKAAAFLAIEIGVWAVAYSYDKKGDRQTDLFQDYANLNWSVVRYGQYAQDNLVQFITDPNNRTFGWLISNDVSLKPWQRVNWNELNRMEREISRTAEGRYYSHTLPLHGDQQYYELIGKYQQYNQGWNDAPAVYQYGPDNVTPNFRYYAAERGKANDFYETARTAVTIAVVNHIISALDAAWSAHAHNKLQAQIGTQELPVLGQIERVPVLSISYEL